MNIRKLSQHTFLKGVLFFSATILMCGCAQYPHTSDISNATDAQSIELLPEDTYVPAASTLCDIVTDDDEYKLSAEDVLNVKVFGEEELSDRYALNNKGIISLPLVGDINLSGCTLDQVRKLITEKYAGDYLVNPSVLVEIDSYRPFYVMGEVQAPGRYDYSIGMDSLKAVGLAGGFTYRAKRETALILRRDPYGNKQYHKQAIEDDIQPGDVIFVKGRIF